MSTRILLLACGIFFLLTTAQSVEAAPAVPSAYDHFIDWQADRLPRQEGLLPASLGSPSRLPGLHRATSILIDEAFQPTPSPSPVGTPVEQVIVTSAGLETAFQALADRETRRGIPTVVRTLPWITANYGGADEPARIRTFLREAYDFWGTKYVLLGGDVEIVPARYVPWEEEEIPADMYYACLDREWNEDGDAIFAEPVTAAALDGYLNDVATAPDGRVWVATYFGVAVLDAGQFQSWDETDGLPSSTVYSVDVASDGSVWVGCKGGVARWDGTVWQSFTPLDGMLGNDAVSVEAVSVSEAWIGTTSGLNHFDGGVWETWGFAEGIPAVPVTDVVTDGSVVWLSTPGGAAKLEGGALTIYDKATSGILSNWVLSVAIDDLGRVWFGHANNYFARGGVSRFDGSTWFTDDLPAWSGMSVRSLAIESGGAEFWAATSAGLFHRAPGGDELLGTIDGLTATDCYSAAFSPDGVAIATAAGLTTGLPNAWSTYTVADGLPAAPVDYDDIDLVPDLRVARLPAQSPGEVAVYIQKLADYQDGTLVDHVERTLFLGENLFGPGDGKAFCTAAKSHFPGSFVAEELYEVDGTENLASVLAGLNAGPGWIVHVGHGSYDAMGIGAGLELLFNSHVSSVDAGGRSAFLTVYSCNAGAFDLESSSEAFLFNPNGGAIAVLANSREATPSVDASLDEEFFDGVFASADGMPLPVLDGIWASRVAAMPSDYETVTWWRRMFLSRTFQGVPTLALWRAVPGTLAVIHPSSVPLVRAPFTVHVADAGSSLPVEGARVCVSKGGEDYAYGTTDANGDITFQFRPETVGPVDVVVVTADHVPYEGVATATTSTGPSPVADGWQPSPARSGVAGQTDLMLAVRNVGLASASGWNVQLASGNADVIVVNGVGTLPALAGGETAWVGPFTIAIGSGLESGEVFAVQLDGNGEMAFSESFTIEVSASDLHLDGLDLTAGEIRPVVTNLGSGATGALTATLAALDQLGTVIDSVGASAGAGPGGTVTFTDGFVVVGPDDARFELRVTDASGRAFTTPIDRQAPDPVSLAASEPRDDGALLTWTPSPSTDVVGYFVEANTAPGTWTDEFGGPVGQGAMAQVLFAAGTSRDYRVTAVDTAGNRSVAVEFPAYAAPTTLPGWPRRLPSLLGPAPIVLSDLDGNGSPEVIVGSMWETDAVHVFHVDGSEWTDGDNNPNTAGVFGVTQGRLHAATLAVDVDHDGFQEIFAASFDGSVYGWRTDNTNGGAPQALPGWPIFHTAMGVRTAPVAADLDGDGELEIVTVANDGLVRAFHPDGSSVTGWPRTTGGLATGSKPAILDLNLDGRDDVVFAATDSMLYVVSGDGTDFPGWPRPVGASAQCSPVLVDLDGDDAVEVVCMTRAGDVVAYHLGDNDGTPGADPVAGWPVRIDRYAFTPPSPAVADFDHDGTPEIVVAGGSELVVLRADGTFYPGFPREFGFDVINSPVVADLDGDGSLDILIGTMDRRLWAIAVDGSVLPGWPRVFHERPWSTPYVADVDDDGDLDVVLGADDMYLRIVDVAGPATAASAPWPGYHGGDRGGVYQPPPPAVGTPGPWIEPARPATLELAAPAPNPFRGGTTLRFATPRQGPVWLEIYDVTGRRVARPFGGEVLPAGSHQIAWDGRDGNGQSVATGVYFLRLRSEDGTRTGRAVRIR